MATTSTRDSGYVRRGNAGGAVVAGFAGAIAIINAVIHFIETPSYLQEKAWLGSLFIIGGVALVVAAIGLFARKSTWAWWLGALVSAGMLIGGILSRTTGLFNCHETAWEASLIVSLVLDVLYLMLFATSGFGSKKL